MSAEGSPTYQIAGRIQPVLIADNLPSLRVSIPKGSRVPILTPGGDWKRRGGDRLIGRVITGILSSRFRTLLGTIFSENQL